MPFGKRLSLGLALVVATMMCGCTSSRNSKSEIISLAQDRPSKFSGESFDHVSRAASPGSAPGGLFLDEAVIPASGLFPPVPTTDPKPAETEGPRLPPPGEATQPREMPKSVLPGQSDVLQAPPPVIGGLRSQRGGHNAVNPHLRSTPTASGALLNLGPNEAPADRVVELAQKVESLAAQIAVLHGRIREMEALAVSREQAIAEARRESEYLTTEAARYRAEVEVLKSRITQIEREDIKLMEAVIAVLEKLLGGPGGRIE